LIQRIQREVESIGAGRKTVLTQAVGESG
jgi:hypothetical protein